MRTTLHMLKGIWGFAMASPYFVIAACLASAIADMMSPGSTLAGFSGWLAANMPVSIGMLLVVLFFVSILWHNFPKTNAEKQAAAERTAAIVADEGEETRINQSGGGFRAKGI